MGTDKDEKDHKDKVKDKVKDKDKEREEGGKSLELGSALNAISLSPDKRHAFVVGRDGMWTL